MPPRTKATSRSSQSSRPVRLPRAGLSPSARELDTAGVVARQAGIDCLTGSRRPLDCGGRRPSSSLSGSSMAPTVARLNRSPCWRRRGADCRRQSRFPLKWRTDIDAVHSQDELGNGCVLGAKVSDNDRERLHAGILASATKTRQFIDAYQSDSSARAIIYAVFTINCSLIGIHIALRFLQYFGLHSDNYRDFFITTDRGYPEIVSYLQLAVLGWLMLHVFVRTQNVIYATLGIIFLFALADDALQLHERVGKFAESVDLPAPAAFGATHFGEVLHWSVVGAMSVAVLVYGFVASSAEDRKIGAIFVLLIFMLGFFAAFLDAVHIILGGRFFASNFIMDVAEDGGEMLTIALALSMGLLLYRHLDDLRRPPRRSVRGRPPSSSQSRP
jgi:hypothetical protein